MSDQYSEAGPNCCHLKFRWAARYTSNRCHGQGNNRIFELPRLLIREIVLSPIVSHLLNSGMSTTQSLPRMLTRRNYEPPLCHACSLLLADLRDRITSSLPCLITLGFQELRLFPVSCLLRFLFSSSSVGFNLFYFCRAHSF